MKQKHIQYLKSFLNNIDGLKSESARSHRFTALLQELLGLELGFIEDYLSGVEKFLTTKQKDQILKGRADNLFGNVIIEFESSIPKKLPDAEEQLKRYTAIAWSNEKPDSRAAYLCIATDGVRFSVYTPVAINPSAQEITPEEIYLNLIEEADWNKYEPEEIYYWLDRYFLRKEILKPTSETIIRDFGVKSHAFQTTVHVFMTAWHELKDRSDYSVVYDNWNKYLRIVYGNDVGGDELFARHTYLATVAKVMAWKRISPDGKLGTSNEIVRMLHGGLFKAQGIENFIEEDFFSWPARPEASKAGVDAVRGLMSLFGNYDLGQLTEDVLKSLYQELVSAEMRHELGEFYTPDWLAHRIIRKLLDSNPKGKVLDPACGSGTFLYLAIREKKERLGESVDTLRHILDSVYGIDVHPLAIIITKTNYLLALGTLLKRRKESISIPVYLADSIKLPELEREPKLWMQLPSFRVELDGREIHLPEILVENSSLYDSAIELAREYALQEKSDGRKLDSFKNFLQARKFQEAGHEGLVKAILIISDMFRFFIDAGKDTIWAFILKNIYKPLFLKCKFDFIVGNPPWIAFRYTDPEYQKFLKKQIVDKYQLLKGSGHLITHMEIAALFLVRTAELYLKSGGMIGFVLPRGLFTADQHDGLRRGEFSLNEQPAHNLVWQEMWDCENVQPLFNVPSCVIIAGKLRNVETKYPVHGEILSGVLEHRNMSLAEAQKVLSVKIVPFSLHQRGKRSFWSAEEQEIGGKASPYKMRFAQGATIVPRSFWFVKIKPSPLGFDPNVPPLETADRALAQAKPAYKDVRMDGAVESRFLYATLLSTDLLPFGHLDYRLVILPLEAKQDHYEILDINQAKNNGYLSLAKWLEKAEREWIKARSAKAERSSVLDWLDYRGKLTKQNPQAKCRIIYNTSGTFLAAAVVEAKKIIFKIDEQEVETRGFVTDYVTYGLDISNRKEGNFLASILNSHEIDIGLKPMQARGLWGPRHICGKVFDLPIPQFNPENPTHLQLSELGQKCTAKVKRWVDTGNAGKIKSIGKLRSMVREMLKDDLVEIDKLVREII